MCRLNNYSLSLYSKTSRSLCLPVYSPKQLYHSIHSPKKAACRRSRPTRTVFTKDDLMFSHATSSAPTWTWPIGRFRGWVSVITLECFLCNILKLYNLHYQNMNNDFIRFSIGLETVLVKPPYILYIMTIIHIIFININMVHITYRTANRY